MSELLPKEPLSRDGGGTIDFVCHATNCVFVRAVTICLNAPVDWMAS